MGGKAKFDNDVYTNMQDIVQYQKRAGYSVIGREVSVASPTNRHVRECQFSPSCLECAAFVKSLAKDGNEDVPSLLLEIERVVVECNGKIPITTTTTVNIVEEEEQEKKKKDVDANRLLRSVTEEYAELKKNGRLLAENLDPATEALVVFLQNTMLYFDENNQYGGALKRPLPVGNYCWMIQPTAKALKEIMCEKKRREDYGQRVVDFFACVDLELPDDCSPQDRQCEEEFNLLVASDTPNAFKFSEKLLGNKREPYVRRDKKTGKTKYKSLSLNKKLMSGVERRNNYWLHSSLLGMALTNGWRIASHEHHGVANPHDRCVRPGEGLDFRATFHKLMNNESG